MVRAVRTLLEFCYLVRWNIINEPALEQIQIALNQFYRYCEAFKEAVTVFLSFLLPM